ncbi:uncharacterized protein LOC112042804 [Bicyclus anynana]|uniref:Uncharacterized protein LOC112042804 n=1 Tax=Bicyclus anynana TaxID=110368 RepID=A0A6J1MHD6_BICAN|nr:uncharacterized protein LOC112042804 [Bicyclus anynana]
MPPRKVNNLPKKGAEIKSRGREKIVKKVLKTPSVLKLKFKLPSVKNIQNVNEDGLLNNLGNENKNTEIVTKTKKKPVTRKKAIVKKQGVKRKNQNGEQTTNNDVPVKKRIRAKTALKKDNAVKTNDAVKEDETNYDVPTLNENYYKILLANEVVNSQFTKKFKHIDQLPVEQGLQEPTTTKKKKSVLNNKTVLQKKVPNDKVPATKELIKTKKCSQSKKRCNKKNSLEEIDIQPNVTTKVNELSVESMNTKKCSQEKKRCYKKKSLEEKRTKVSVEHVLQENKEIVKKKQISTRKPALKNKVLNVKKEVIKLPKTNKKFGRPRKLPIVNAFKDNIGQINVTGSTESKDDKNKMNNQINSEVSEKRKLNLSLIRKNVSAGPESQNQLNGCVNEIQVHNTEEKCIKDTFNIRASDACSDMSWLKDISSTSNSSTVTAVKSNDFYSIDNKMPVLQLYNIDKSILRKNNKYLGVSNTRTETPKSVLDQNKDRSIQETVINKESDKQYGSDFQPNKANSISVSSKRLSVPSKTENIKTTSKENSTRSSLQRCNSSSSSSSSSTTSSSNSSSSSSNSLSKVSCDKNLDSNKNMCGQGSGSSTGKTLNEKTALGKLVLKLKTHNSKIKNYQCNNENTNRAETVNKMQDKIFRDDILKFETDLYSLCQSIKRLEVYDVDKYFNCNEIKKSNYISRPVEPVVLNSEDCHTTTEHLNSDAGDNTENIGNTNFDNSPKEAEAEAEISNERTNQSDSCFFYDKSNFTSAAADDDDDDALSLFAESFTECEPSRRNSVFNSEMSQYEEYIPRPTVNKFSSSAVNYQPTKISNKNIENKKLQCTSPCEIQYSTEILNTNIHQCSSSSEIQKADSTSDFSQKPSRLPITDPKKTWTSSSSSPRLMASIHKPNQRQKNLIFSGYCFFNLASTCQRPNCLFSHRNIKTMTVENSLKTLSEEKFIQEYMLIRHWGKLKRNYGLCFVEECIRRELTRILVEMAIDFIVKPNDVTSDVVDNVLMYLNNVDLSVCDDLLRYNLSRNKQWLCDYFMSVIATSQNFSRFKSIFVKLTEFMHQNGRTFMVDIAESVLERLCILPYEETLARSLITILKNSDVSVFYNAKISYFERQLIAANNNNLYREFKLLKDHALAKQPVLGNHYEPQNQDIDNLNSYSGHVEKNKSKLLEDQANQTNLGNPYETINEPDQNQDIDSENSYCEYAEINGFKMVKNQALTQPLNLGSHYETTNKTLQNQDIDSLNPYSGHAGKNLFNLFEDQALANQTVLRNPYKTINKPGQNQDTERVNSHCRYAEINEFKMVKNHALTLPLNLGSHYEPTNKTLQNQDIDSLNSYSGHAGKNTFNLFEDQALANQTGLRNPYKTINKPVLNQDIDRVNSYCGYAEKNKFKIVKNQALANPLNLGSPYEPTNKSLQNQDIDSLNSYSGHAGKNTFNLFEDQSLTNQTVPQNLYENINEPRRNQDVDRLNSNSGPTEKSIIPQVTDLTNVNNPPIVTKFKRTFNMEKLKHLGFINTKNNADVSTDRTETANAKEKYKLGIFENCSNTDKQIKWQRNYEMFCNRPIRPPKRRSDQIDEGSAPKYKWKQNFYHKRL